MPNIRFNADIAFAAMQVKRMLDGLVLLHELNFSGINLDLILKKGIIEV